MKKIIYYATCGFVLLVLFLQESCKKKEIEMVSTVTINSISDSLLTIGDTLIIKGAHFDPSPAGNLVSVASVSYTVIQASSGQLSVVVPKAAQSGTLSVGLPGGRATQFGAITIIGATQPVIISISPVTAYEGDTIVVTGKNFAIPYTANSITFNGTSKGVIVNATPTELKVAIPDLTFSGPVQITTNGQSSPAYAYTIGKTDPNIDGHINWLSMFYEEDNYGIPAGEVTSASFFRGETNTALPQAKSLFSVSGALFPRDFVDYDWYSPGFSYYNLYNFVVSDLQHNAYYMKASAYPFPAEYHLMKMPADNPSQPVSVWSQTFDPPGQYTEVVNNSYGTTLQVPYAPLQQIGIDGNTLYIKLGATDDYYVGDVSQPTPAFTLQHHVIGDTAAYELQFGQDYIFYLSAGVIPGYTTDSPPADTLRYIGRNSKIIHNVPLDDAYVYAAGIVSIMADPSHGNDLLIVTRGYSDDGNGYVMVIRKFNPDTQQMTVLYNHSNWADSYFNYDGVGSSGFIWLGHHIYYACGAQAGSYTTLHRLNDDGSSARAVTIYGRMEPLTTNKAPRFSLFTGK